MIHDDDVIRSWEQTNQHRKERTRLSKQINSDTYSSTMAPYSELTHGDNDVDAYRSSLERKSRVTDLGFSAPLLESITTFKSKMENWVEQEKSKADLRLKSYNKGLLEQQNNIDSQVSELARVQRERGMEDDIVNSNMDENENHQENIAYQKKSLEEQSIKLQIEIMKLTTERDNREKRVQGKFTLNENHLVSGQCNFRWHWYDTVALLSWLLYLACRNLVGGIKTAHTSRWCRCFETPSGRVKKHNYWWFDPRCAELQEAWFGLPASGTRRNVAVSLTDRISVFP